MTDLSDVADGGPSKEKIKWAVRWVFPNQSGGPSGIHSEHLKICPAAVQEEENPDPSRSWIVLEMVQLAFDTGELATECTWATFIILTKGSGNYRIIGLIEVIWKVISIMVNRRLVDLIEFHDVLHNFREWRVTRT